MAKWDVNYDGWLVVEAKDEEHAFAVANSILSQAKITNDGLAGEWYILTAEQNEEN